MSFENLIYTVDGGAATIALNREGAMNALDRETARELRAALWAVEQDPEVRALVVTGSGRAFSAGGDVAGFFEAGSEASATVDDLVVEVHAAISQMESLRVPIVAGVNGVTAGAGMGLMLACDLAVAARSASFVMAYTAIGATPDGSSTFHLPRLIGTRRALELALLNRRLDAEEALEWGLINRVVEDSDLPDRVRELAGRLAAGPSLAYAGTRRLIRRSLATPFGEQLDAEARSIVAMGSTADFQEGVAAFMEKRPPRFTGS